MKITWSDFWSVCRDIILPESWTVIWSVIVYGFLGILVTILILVLGSRYKVFTRIPKYYNWAVKLYIPLVILGTVYFALQIGFFRGIYKVMHNEAPVMTDGIYGLTVDQLFSTQAEKDAYLNDLKVLAATYSHSSSEFAEHLKADIVNKSVGVGVLDQAKNGAASWLIDTFKDDIFSAVVFGALSMAGEKAGVSEGLSWSESSRVVDLLMQTQAAQLEVAIQKKLNETLESIFYKQYSKYRTASIGMWFLIVCLVPIIEFVIYKRYLEPKFLQKQAEAERLKTLDAMPEA
ncbi:MAG: hypothetical protein IPP17_06510 [Bacteroidetes bacterium]|nr:hypothetical protein [Bacteroidota bacterium]